MQRYFQLSELSKRLEDEQRKAMTYGKKLHITFESKVMHFFDAETGVNLLA